MALISHSRTRTANTRCWGVACLLDVTVFPRKNWSKNVRRKGRRQQRNEVVLRGIESLPSYILESHWGGVVPEKATKYSRLFLRLGFDSRLFSYVAGWRTGKNWRACATLRDSSQKTVILVQKPNSSLESRLHFSLFLFWYPLTNRLKKH